MAEGEDTKNAEGQGTTIAEGEGTTMEEGKNTSTDEEEGSTIDEPEGRKMGNKKFPGLFYSLIWFIGLLAISIPVALCAAILYIIIRPFGICYKPPKDFCNLLLMAMQLPKTFATNMRYMNNIYTLS